MITPVRVSYAVLAATIILAGILHLGAPLLVSCFRILHCANYILSPEENGWR
jgi:hypothetical protein